MATDNIICLGEYDDVSYFVRVGRVELPSHDEHCDIALRVYETLLDHGVIGVNSHIVMFSGTGAHGEILPVYAHHAAVSPLFEPSGHGSLGLYFARIFETLFTGPLNSAPKASSTTVVTCMRAPGGPVRVAYYEMPGQIIPKMGTTTAPQFAEPLLAVSRAKIPPLYTGSGRRAATLTINPQSKPPQPFPLQTPLQLPSLSPPMPLQFPPLPSQVSMRPPPLQQPPAQPSMPLAQPPAPPTPPAPPSSPSSSTPSFPTDGDVAALCLLTRDRQDDELCAGLFGLKSGPQQKNMRILRSAAGASNDG